MNIYQHWMPEDENRLIELYETTDMTVRELAANMGRGTGAVQARLSSLRAANRIASRQPAALPETLRDRVLELYDSGMKYVDIAKETGQSYNRVSGIITNHRRKVGLRVERGSRAESDTPRSTGSSVLDSALTALRKELQMLSLQQYGLATRISDLRRTISRVERITQ